MPKGIIFSGQGAQKVGMGKSLYENSDVAKQLYDRANEVLGYDFTKVCFEGPQEELTKTNICQPALYVHGYTVYQLVKEKLAEPSPSVAMGLSLGELTALAVADTYDFETGLKIVAERGRLMQMACDETDGGMASIIGGERDAVKQLCDDCDVDMANLNCPGQIVISGESSKIADAVNLGKERGFKRVIPLVVAGAYHSRLMEPAREAFENYLSGIEFRAPSMTVFSNVDAASTNDPEAIKANLVKQVVSSVLWEDCMLSAKSFGVNEFTECGVGGVLKGLARRIDRNLSVNSVEEFEQV